VLVPFLLGLDLGESRHRDNFVKSCTESEVNSMIIKSLCLPQERTFRLVEELITYRLIDVLSGGEEG